MKSRSGCLRRVLLLPIDVYGMMMILMLLAQGLIGERWNLVGLFNTFAQLFWIPAFFFIPFALLLRSRRTLVLLLPAVLAFFITFGDRFLPHAALVPDPNQTAFSVVTFNLYDNGREPDELIMLIKEMDADVVAMQELGAGTAAAFDEKLATLYPYRALHPGKREFEGSGLMSKYPITADRSWSYASIAYDNFHQRVELEIAGRPVTLYNVHPVAPNSMGEFYNSDRRSKGIAALLEETKAETGSYFMVGDFNMPELSEDYAHVVHDYGFVDAFRVRSWGLGTTFTHGFAVPFLRLDYLFLHTGVDVAEVHGWATSAGSDHRPVFAQLVLTPQ